MKETQGSIEETTFGQMNNILAYGCYLVGSQRPQIFHSIHDIIHLILTERDKPLTKKQYTLNELRDLESKLALIVGKNAENRTEVGLFTHTLHNVCRIAEVLISLQQVGNVKYTGWRLQVPCGLGHIVPKLQYQAKEMEQELKYWEEEVTQKRGKFYELNYFTTLQLLTLRRELGVFKSNLHTGPTDVTPNVLALLESISTQMTAMHVFATVQNVISDTIRSAVVLSSTPLTAQTRASGVSPSPSSLAVFRCPLAGEAATSSQEVPTLSQEILRSANVHTASGAEEMMVEVEMPKISEDELTPKQRGIMQDLMKRYDFSSSLVLKAFEECKDGETKYDIEHWCNDNADKYDFGDEEQQEEDFSDDEVDKKSDASSMDFDNETYTYQQQTTPLSCPGRDIFVREGLLGGEEGHLLGVERLPYRIHDNMCLKSISLTPLKFTLFLIELKPENSS